LRDVSRAIRRRSFDKLADLLCEQGQPRLVGANSECRFLTIEAVAVSESVLVVLIIGIANLVLGFVLGSYVMRDRY
jgi:hypothetical protein